MKKKALFVLGVSILAFLLRWYASNSLPIDYDEPVYYTAARFYADAIRTGHRDRIPQVDYNYEHPALAKLVYGTVLSLLPPDGPVTDNEWAYFTSRTPLTETRDPFRISLLRQVSVAFGTLAVFILSLFFPLAGIFLAIDSIAIKYTSVIYLEAMPAFFTVVSIFLFSSGIAWLRSSDRSSLRSHYKQIVYLLLSALFLGMAAAAKYQYGVAGLAMVIFYLFWVIRLRPADPGRYFLLILFGLAALLAFVAADPYLWPSPLGRLMHSLQFSLSYSHGEAVQLAGYPF